MLIRSAARFLVYLLGHVRVRTDSCIRSFARLSVNLIQSRFPEANSAGEFIGYKLGSCYNLLTFSFCSWPAIIKGKQIIKKNIRNNVGILMLDGNKERMSH